MSERVVVPDIITKKVHEVLRRHEGYPHPDSGDSGRLLILAEAVCETFATALSEHPIVPTQVSIHQATRDAGITLKGQDWDVLVAKIIIAWQPIMFRNPNPAPEPDVPEAVKLDDLLYSNCMIAASQHNDEIHEAYRRGLWGTSK